MVFLLFIAFIRLNFLNSSENEKCAIFDDVTGDCLACSELYYNKNGSPFTNFPFPKEQCLEKLSTSHKMEVFVSDWKCEILSPCDGTSLFPMDNVIDALEKINTEAEKFVYSTVKLFILGDNLYILEENLRGMQRYYFRRSLISLEISPYPCELEPIPGCKFATETLTLIFKTNKFFFFISGLLKIKNLNFNGMDMPIEFQSNIECYSQKALCCLSPEFDCSSYKKYEGALNVNTSWALFNLELSGNSDAGKYTGFPFPRLLLQDCFFFKLVTVFPTNEARFGSIINSKDRWLNIYLTNITFMRCDITWGIVNIEANRNDNFSIQRKDYSFVEVKNVSIVAHTPASNTRELTSLFNIKGYYGELSFSFLTFFDYSWSPPEGRIILFALEYLDLPINFRNLLIYNAQNVYLINCLICKSINFEYIIIKDVHVNDESNWNSGFFKVNGNAAEMKFILLDSVFVINNKKALPTFEFSDKFLSLNTNEFYVLKSENLSFFYRNTAETIKNFVLMDFVTSFYLIKCKNCGKTFDFLVFSNLFTYNTTLVWIENDHIAGNTLLSVTDSLFIDVIFTSTFDGTVFCWGLNKQSNTVRFQNMILVSPSTIYFIYSAYLYDLSLENIYCVDMIDINLSLIYLYELSQFSITNLTIAYFKPVNEYLIMVTCTNCKISMINITLEHVSLYFDVIYFQGYSLGYFENMNFFNISNNFCRKCNDFNVLSFWFTNSTFLKDVLFLSSQNLNTFPFRFFYFFQNNLIVLDNLTFQGENTTPAALYILTSVFFKSMKVSSVFARNFKCSELQGITQHENGIFAFLNSLNYLKGYSDIYPGELVLSNLAIDKCISCKHGIIGIINVVFVLLNNLVFSFSNTEKGGCLAFNNGKYILIENFFSNSTVATLSGGTVFIKSVENVNVKGFFSFNSSATNGGSLYLNDLKVFLAENIHCIDGKSSDNGGSIFVENTAQSLFLNGLIFYSYAAGQGGCFYSRKGFIMIGQGFLALHCIADIGGFLAGIETRKIIISDLKVENAAVVYTALSFFLYECQNIIIQKTKIFGSEWSNDMYSNILLEVPSRSKILYALLENTEVSGFQGSNYNFIEVNNDMDKDKVFDLKIINSNVSESEGAFINLKARTVGQKQILLLNNIKIENSTKNPGFFFYFENIIFNISSILIENTCFHSDVFLFNNVSFSIYQINVLFSVTDLCNNIFKRRYLFSILNSAGNMNFIGSTLTFTQHLGCINSKNSMLRLNYLDLNECSTFFESCLYFKGYQSINITFGRFNQNKGQLSGVITCINCSMSVRNTSFGTNNAFIYKRGYSGSNDLLIEASGFVLIESCTFRETSELAVFVFNSTVKIGFSNFHALNTTAYSNIKALYGLESDIEITNSLFSNFSSSSGGTLTIVQNNNNYVKNFVFTQSKITNSISDFGGAFLITGIMSVIIERSEFHACSAVTKNQETLGIFGVGAFLCRSCLNTKFSLQFNLFYNNFAGYAFPTVFYLSNKSNITDFFKENKFFNNFDKNNFTQNISSTPLKIKIFVAYNKKHEYLEVHDSDVINIHSGEPFSLMFRLTDAFGQVLSFLNDFLVEILEIPDSNRTMLYIPRKDIKKLCIQGEYYMEGITINTDPNHYFLLQIVIDPKIDNIFPANFDKIPILPFNLTFFSNACVIGELYIFGDQSCFECPSEKYSIDDPMRDLNGQECLWCPKNAICTGGSAIIPKAGFWRNSPRSTLIIECRSKASCLGFADGNLTEDELTHGKCNSNSFGIQCHECDQGYARFSDWDTCKPCSSDFKNYIKFALVMVGIILYITVQIKMTFEIAKASSVGILLKLLVMHFQQIGMITIVDLGWSEEMKEFFSIQTYFSLFSDDLVPADCLIQRLPYNPFTQKMMITNILPILLSIFLFLVWSLTSFCLSLFQNKKMSSSQETFRVIFIIVIVLLFPTLMNKCLNFFNCVLIDNAQPFKVLLESPNVICWEADHIKYILYIALPGLITWGILAPLYLANQLFKNCKQIKKIVKSSYKKKRRAGNDEQAKVLELLTKMLSYGKNVPKALKRRQINIPINPPTDSCKGLLADSPTTCIKALIDLENQNFKIPELRKEALNYTSKESLGRVKSKVNVTSADIRKALSLRFLYKGYSHKYYYWELFMFLKKFSLISINCITEFFPPPLKGTILLVQISFFLLIQIRKKPYESKTLNRMELFSLVVGFLTANVGVLMISPFSKDITDAFLIFIIIVNSSYMIYWSWFFFREAPMQFPLSKICNRLYTHRNLKKVIPAFPSNRDWEGEKSMTRNRKKKVF